MEEFKESLRWAIYGISIAALFILGVAVYLITRIVDGNWTDWKLPAIMGIVFVVLVSISSMYSAIPEIKNEIEKEAKKEKRKK